MTRPRVAIAHDFLNVKGGGERVALALADAFPGAPLHTALYEPSATFAEFADVDVRTSALNRVKRFRSDHRLALPFLPTAFRSMTIDADVVICSSAGFAHHVRSTGHKVVYCHTPARWLYDMERYSAGWGPVARVAARVLRPAFAHRDRSAMAEAELIMANSPDIAREIREVYSTDATVVPPCSSLRTDGAVQPIAGIEPGFVLCPSRILGYKRLDVLVEAARLLPDQQFVHVGSGPHAGVFDDCPSNLISFGAVDDAELRWAYRNARAVAITCAEDFGLVPLEADAHGLPAIVPFARGLVDNAAAQRCGVFYRFGSAESLVDALQRAAPCEPRTVRPDRLGSDDFVDALRANLDLVPA